MVSPRYVVTNAHVVAGDSSVAVQGPSLPAAVPAVVVAFDPRLDLAVLYVAGLQAPAVSLEERQRSRGDDGAILGYPEGGPFDAEAAGSASAHGGGPGHLRGPGGHPSGVRAAGAGATGQQRRPVRPS